MIFFWWKSEAKVKINVEAWRVSTLELIPFCQLQFNDANLCFDCCNPHSLCFVASPVLDFTKFIVRSDALSLPSGFLNN